MAKKKNKEPLLPFPHTPWNQCNNAIWLGSRLKLIRNVEKFKFPGKLDINRRKQILALISKELQNCPPLAEAQIYKADEMDPLGKEYLFEHFLATETFHQAHTGDAFAVDAHGRFLAVINLRNHLQLHLLDHKGELEKSWNQLIKYESALSKTLKFAFANEFGFLTADPGTCGTGLVGNVFLHVPALIHRGEIFEVLQKHRDEQISALGLQGDPEDFVGDMLVIHNAYTLGVSEENIISTLRSFTTHLILEEKSARSRIRSGDKIEVIKDQVSRAFGLLKYSFNLETLESLKALSLLKLGLDLNWVAGVDIAALNSLFFICRRAHLMSELNEQLTNEELPHRRAQFLQETLKAVTLTI